MAERITKDQHTIVRRISLDAMRLWFWLYSFSIFYNFYTRDAVAPFH